MSRFETIALAFALMFVATACGSDEEAAGKSGIVSHGQGSMTLLFTDPPGRAITSALVTIDQVYLEGPPPKDPEVPPTRVDLLPEPMVIDRTATADGLVTLAENAPIPKGRYAHLRVVVGGALIEVASPGGGSLYATKDYDLVPEDRVLVGRLKLPLPSHGGVEIELPPAALDLEQEAMTMVIDFDLGESPQRSSGNGDLILHPSGHATSMPLAASLEVDVALGPDVMGPAVPASGGEPRERTLDGFTAALWYGASDEVRALPLEDEDGDGVYTAIFPTLIPSAGPYVLALEPTEDVWIWSEPVVPVDIDLMEGEARVEAITVVEYGFSLSERASL
jgi:hypothetical protein